MLLALVALVAGLVLLVYASDHFVMGAARLAQAFEMSPVVIGAVIMGFGTSAPELLISSIAAAQGDLDLGVGNITGSNVANLTLVLGTAALITQMSISSEIVKREGPLCLFATLAFAVVVIDDEISRMGGIILAIALVAVLAFLILGGHSDIEHDEDFDDWTTRGEVIRVVAGLVGTVAGAQILIYGATEIADRAGLSGGFIGFSLVALGTSLPELVTTLACARRNETELIVGNLLGSNVFNSLAVGGAIGIVGPGVVGDDHLTLWGTLLMAAIAIVAYGLMLLGRSVSRRDGAVLLALYVAAMVTLATGSSDDDDDAATLQPVPITAHAISSPP